MKLFWHLLMTGLTVAGVLLAVATISYELVYNPHGATASAFYFRK